MPEEGPGGGGPTPPTEEGSEESETEGTGGSGSAASPSALSPSLRWFDEEGERQPLPVGFVQAWNFELLARGGYGAFSLGLFAELDDAEIPVLPTPDWRFEVWFGEEIAYRGWVEKVRPMIQEGAPVFRVEGAGRMVRLSNFQAQCVWAKPYGEDVAEIFTWLADKFLDGEERLGNPDFATLNDIGYRMERVEFNGDLRQAFDRLADAAQDLLIWGFDVGPDGRDRLYVRQRLTTVTQEAYRFRIGREVQYLEQPVDLAELVNAVRFRGGKAKTPNKVFNPSFELPQLPGYGRLGNRVVDGSFEDGDSAWTYGGAADRLNVENALEGVYAKRGKWVGRLRNAGDYVEQTVSGITGGDKYRFQCWYTLQSAGSTSLKIRVEALHSDGSSYSPPLYMVGTDEVQRVTLTGSPTGGTFTLTYSAETTSAIPYDASAGEVEEALEALSTIGEGRVAVVEASGGWDVTFTGSLGGLNLSEMTGSGAGLTGGSSPAVGVVTVTQGDPDRVRVAITARRYTQFVENFEVPEDCGRLRIRLTAGENDPNILLDNVYLFDDNVVQDGWVDQTEGHARAATHWACEEEPGLTPFHGIYCVRVKTRRIKPPEHVVRITPAKWQGIAAKRITDYEVRVRVRAEAALKVRLGLHVQKEQGGSRYEWGSVTTLAGDGSWETVAATLNSGSESSTIRPVVELRSAGTYWLDAVDVYDSGVEDRTYFLPGEELEFAVRVDEGLLTGLSAEALESISLFGLREAPLDVEEITDYGQALPYLTGYLNRYAVPLRQGQLMLVDPESHVRYVSGDGLATPLGLVAVGGARQSIPDQFPVRIQYGQEANGVLRCDLELTHRAPDPALLILQEVQKRSKGGGRSGGGGGRGSGSPGNSVTVGESGSAPSWRVNGAEIGSRSALNLVAGLGVTLTGTDDESDDEVEVLVEQVAPPVAFPVQIWSRQTIQDAGTSYGEMPQPGTTSIKTGLRMRGSGTVVGITLQLSGDVGGSGDDYAVRLYKNGSAQSAATVTVSGGSGAQDYGSWSGGVAYGDGDVLTLYDQKSGGVANVNAGAAVWVEPAAVEVS